MNLEAAYEELQHVKGEVIEALKCQLKELPALLTKLEGACSKICFNYESEYQHCKNIVLEEIRPEGKL